jgi:hypothetical protein
MGSGSKIAFAFYEGEYVKGVMLPEILVPGSSNQWDWGQAQLTTGYMVSI